ncbi:glutaminyl-peptide cyclotransferase [Sediminibacterium sp.]|uniref:glutaminyl-peptide cyclotransferase n=1 Tax=Sediminibacterium sp. TaxID=1917865 RepID=UPI0027324361|nr:glutaminyl-peptide cyclotransferase [Sediminibacterium sp.]MDP3567498.1 glutaminyl-peptide cyclotransferase [Sediminibacterium sp.]
MEKKEVLGKYKKKNMNKQFKKAGILFILIQVLISCGTDTPKEKPNVKTVEVEKPAIPILEYTTVATLPHDETAFTEGFLIHDNKLFESTGSPDHLPNLKSVFGIVDWKTGKLDVKVELDRNIYFGEGIVILKNKIYQITYENQVGFIYDEKTYKKIGQFNYSNKEGWGLTTDGTFIIMSDGTNKLTYFDPKEMNPVKTLNVNENGYATDALNELEYINGFIYANIWMTGYVVKIDPKTGNVVAKINFTPMSYNIKNLHPNALEMNGIAFDSIADKIYVTGKLWPYIYEVKFPH